MISSPHRRPHARLRRLVIPLAGALALALGAGACGSSAYTDNPTTTGAPAASSPAASPDAATSQAPTTPAATFPVTIDNPVGSVTIPEQPTRIVSLSPSATEALYAVGAGDQVVAVDRFSNYPANLPVTDLSGYEPNLEAIAALNPDLVITSHDSNDLVAGLTKVSVPVLLSTAPTTLDEGYDRIADIGVATGHVDEAAAVISKMRAELDAAIEAAPKDTRVRVYHELDENHFSASRYSFIGSAYAALGAENIADAADPKQIGYPQLTEEAVIEADPQLIVITDRVGYGPADVAKRPGWSGISAVRNGNIVVVDADLSDRWGPRLPQFLTAISRAMLTVTAPVS